MISAIFVRVLLKTRAHFKTNMPLYKAVQYAKAQTYTKKKKNTNLPAHDLDLYIFIKRIMMANRCDRSPARRNTFILCFLFSYSTPWFSWITVATGPTSKCNSRCELMKKGYKKMPSADRCSPNRRCVPIRQQKQNKHHFSQLSGTKVSARPGDVADS